MAESCPLDTFAFDTNEKHSSLKVAGPLTRRIGNWYNRFTGKSRALQRSNLNKIISGEGVETLSGPLANAAASPISKNLKSDVSSLYSLMTRPGSGVNIDKADDIGGWAQSLLANEKAVRRRLSQLKDPKARALALQRMDELAAVPSVVNPRTNKALAGGAADKFTRRRLRTWAPVAAAGAGAGAAGVGAAYGTGAIPRHWAPEWMPGYQPEYADNPGAKKYYGPERQKNFLESGADSVGQMVSQFSPAIGQWIQNNPYMSAGIGAGGTAALMYLLMQLMQRR